MAEHRKSARTHATLKIEVATAVVGLLFAVPTKAATGTIADVQHVVIMMQENRSFDHYFGTMHGVRGYADRTMLSFPSGNSVLHQPSGGSFLLPFHSSEQIIHDVDHGWNGMHGNWNSGKMDAWASLNGTSAMLYHTRDDLPFYYALADAYTMCDATFCSVMGPTIPNRLYFCTGTIARNASDNGLATMGPVPPEGFNWTTYPERLQAAGVSWKFYRPVGDWIGGTLAFFVQYTNSAGPGNPLYDRGISMVPDVVAAFRADVTNGVLPRVSWVCVPLELTEHPLWSPASGQVFIKQILDVLAADPQLYNSTVFILTYDENGGFFDHVPPPVPPPGTPDEFVNGQPIGLGARVPLLVVSPWSRGGYVCSQVFDLTSVIRFLETWTGVAEPNISAWRRKVCGDLTSAFDFAHPDFSRPVLPDIRPVSGSPVVPQPPATQAVPIQESGTKRARPLPYQPNAASFADCAAGAFDITLTNSGTASVHFSIYANAHLSDGPWQYDVGPGQSGVGTFQVGASGGSYDLTCYGPNGFLRRFAGNVVANCGQIEIGSAIDPVAASLTMTLKNSTAKLARFTVTDDYALGGPWHITVTPGSVIEHTFRADIIRDGWYDLTARVDLDSEFVRRLAGHIETGKVTRSGLIAPPSLSVTLSTGGELLFTYPGVLSGYTLDSSVDLAPGSWSPVSCVANKDHNSNNVVVLPKAAESLFFRLRK